MVLFPAPFCPPDGMLASPANNVSYQKEGTFIVLFIAYLRCLKYLLIHSGCSASIFDSMNNGYYYIDQGTGMESCGVMAVFLLIWCVFCK